MMNRRRFFTGVAACAAAAAAAPAAPQIIAAVLAPMTNPCAEVELTGVYLDISNRVGAYWQQRVGRAFIAQMNEVFQCESSDENFLGGSKIS